MLNVINYDESLYRREIYGIQVNDFYANFNYSFVSVLYNACFFRTKRIAPCVRVLRVSYLPGHDSGSFARFGVTRKFPSNASRQLSDLFGRP